MPIARRKEVEGFHLSWMIDGWKIEGTSTMVREDPEREGCWGLVIFDLTEERRLSQAGILPLGITASGRSSAWATRFRTRAAAVDAVVAVIGGRSRLSGTGRYNVGRTPFYLYRATNRWRFEASIWDPRISEDVRRMTAGNVHWRTMSAALVALREAIADIPADILDERG